MTEANAAGKIILFGEHAVVFGQPAIAVPVAEVYATADVSDSEAIEPGQIRIIAPDIRDSMWLHDAPEDQPLAKAVRLTLEMLPPQQMAGLSIEIRSTIPIASGMGSSAAVSVAIVRALSRHFEYPLPPEEQSSIAFEVEKLHHGTPSGVDNTVVSHEKPVVFTQGEEPKPFEVGQSLNLIIGDTGLPSPTLEAVAMVREGWKQDEAYYQSLFDQIGDLTRLALRSIKAGELKAIGSLMNHNQKLLQALGVSSVELENLIQAAQEVGALGAKLSGAGLGGNMIALASYENVDAIRDAIENSGATRTIFTTVET
ncbi:MAG: mevalonate kinase [Anaerolineales bacterium]|nr:mevalonate kinase [Anaerolineales bacterium]